MEAKAETFCDRLGELLQACGYGKSVKEHRRVDEATNPHGVLETLETRQDEVSKFRKIRCKPFQCRNPGKFEKRLLAACPEPDSSSSTV